MFFIRYQISVAEFLSVVVNLAERSGNIIREVWKSQNIGAQEKDFEQGPVTIADLKVQRTIEYNLRQLYPELDIQGEEDPATYSMYEPMFEPKSIQRDLIKQGVLNEFHEKRKDYLETIRGTYPEVSDKGVLFEKFDVKDAVVWIDPLDGTSDFVIGNLSAVTVLIGLSIKGISRLGVVHNPFTDEDPSKGRTLFGTIEHGLLSLDYDENMSEEVYRTRKISYLEPFDHLEVPK